MSQPKGEHFDTLILACPWLAVYEYLNSLGCFVVCMKVEEEEEEEEEGGGGGRGEEVECLCEFLTYD